MGFVGMIVGGTLAVYLLYALWEFALFRRIMDDPLKGKIFSALAGYLSGSFIAGFGMADGGPYAWTAFLYYLVPGVIVFALAYRRGMQMREEMAVSEAFE